MHFNSHGTQLKSDSDNPQRGCNLYEVHSSGECGKSQTEQTLENIREVQDK